MKTDIIIVGCGGAGAWMAQALARMPDIRDKHRLVLVDGDKLEPRNLDRQLFGPSDVGGMKATALRRHLVSDGFGGLSTPLLVDSVPCYLTPDGFGEDEHGANHLADDVSVMFLAVDNHPARCHALALADRYSFTLVNAANESTDCEAWLYTPYMKDTPLDPRVRWPELMTDGEGDPTAPCTSDEAREADPQTSLANMGAAFFALHLWRFWRGTEIPMEVRPVHHVANHAKMRTLRIQEVVDEN